MTVAAVAALGSTFAANISLNSGAAVEFGQGVALTAACDEAIIVTPGAAFTNSQVAGSTGTFKLGAVTITGIGSACVDKVFKLQFWDSTTATAKTITTTGATHLMAKFQYKSECVPYTEAGAATTTSSTNVTPITTLACSGTGGATGAAVVTLANSTLSATDVYKVTLESGAS
jgi:hypothetical protein